MKRQKLKLRVEILRHLDTVRLQRVYGGLPKESYNNPCSTDCPTSPGQLCQSYLFSQCGPC